MKEKLELLKKTAQEVAVLSCSKLTVGDEFPLEEIDSLGRAEIIVTVEEQFGIQLTNEEIMNMKTYGELISIIKGRASA